MTLIHKIMPLGMGAAMGLAMPFMIHGNNAGGLIFVLAHIAVFVALASIFLVFPGIRHRILSHFNRAHMMRMGGGMAFGFAAICIYCLTVGGQHWT